MPPKEPSSKRAIVFIDGQDLYHGTKEARAAHRKECDVALVFSQDQDLSEVAKEIRVIAREQKRWLRIACAYPMSPTTRNKRGIDCTDWIQIDRDTYNACIDPRDYRAKKKGG